MYEGGGYGFFKCYDPRTYNRGKILLKSFKENERKLAKEDKNLRILMTNHQHTSVDDEVFNDKMGIQ